MNSFVVTEKHARKPVEAVELDPPHPGLHATQYDGGWSLTHKPSGRSLGKADQLSTIREYGNRVVMLTDWTAPHTELSQSVALREQLQKVRRHMFGQVTE